MNRPERIVFLGTPELAVPSLRALAAHFDVALVVTRPDQPAGRRRQPQAAPVKLAALELGLPMYQPASLRGDEAIERIGGERPAFLVVVAFGELLCRRLLAAPSVAPVNAHASLLPRHRGPSPISAAILAGDPETGVTTMRMTGRMDAGPVYLKRSLPILADDTTPSLSARLADVAARLLLETLRGLLDGSVSEQPQAGAPTYTHLVRSDDGFIDWRLPAGHIERMTRAYQPWPCAYTQAPDKKGRPMLLKILKARSLPVHPAAIPGSVLPADERLLIAAGDAAIEALLVQPAGGRVMSAAEFRRGHRLADGLVLPSSR